jgi:hypothetical protein
MDSSLTATQNADIAWSRFDSDDYYRRNYRVLHPEDRQIMRIASDFLIGHFRDGDTAESAIDVGAGTNLYPALLMLPWAAEITLVDVAEPNVAWLSDNVYEPPTPWPWQPFWGELSELTGYRGVVAPQRTLATRCRIGQCSIFDLEPARWDLGSMFFVADGMTRDPYEFAAGVGSFVRSLRPGAPFVAAFMKNSLGYEVGGRDYPAVRVDRDSLGGLFETLAMRQFDVLTTDRTREVVRSGYEGMLVVTGLAG